MTPSEFKAWFDGFTEALDGTPTKAQWARIKARVAEIDGKPVTERIYLDRYWPRYERYPYWTYLSDGGGSITKCSAGAVSGTSYNLAASNAQFSSTNAMNALGRNEASALAAEPLG